MPRPSAVVRLGVVLAASLVLLVMGAWAICEPTTSEAAPRTGLRGDLAVGVSIAGVSRWSVDSARQGGFDHVRHSLIWAEIDRNRGRFPWERDEPNHLDNALSALKSARVGLVLRLDGGPRSTGGRASAAPEDEIRAFYRAVAARAFPHLIAVEVLNEPNLAPEWGGEPDPAAYVRFLRAAYEGVKSVTPDVMVVAGNPSPAPSGPGTIDDLEFVLQMYRAGARGSFDALGIHNYGGNSAPEEDPAECAICFRRAERYREIMVQAGDSQTPIRSTETGYLLRTEQDLGDFNWMKLPADLQASYLQRALRLASGDWPWLQGLTLFNLDHSAAPWHGPETSMFWFSLLNPDYSPRAGYNAVADVLR